MYVTILIFPLSFAVNAAYNRREGALAVFASFKVGPSRAHHRATVHPCFPDLADALPTFLQRLPTFREGCPRAQGDSGNVRLAQLCKQDATTSTRPDHTPNTNPNVLHVRCILIYVPIVLRFLCTCVLITTELCSGCVLICVEIVPQVRSDCVLIVFYLSSH